MLLSFTEVYNVITLLWSYSLTNSLFTVGLRCLQLAACCGGSCLSNHIFHIHQSNKTHNRTTNQPATNQQQQELDENKINHSPEKRRQPIQRLNQRFTSTTCMYVCRLLLVKTLGSTITYIHDIHYTGPAVKWTNCTVLKTQQQQPKIKIANYCWQKELVWFL